MYSAKAGHFGPKKEEMRQMPRSSAPDSLILSFLASNVLVLASFLLGLTLATKYGRYPSMEGPQDNGLVKQ